MLAALDKQTAVREFPRYGQGWIQLGGLMTREKMGMSMFTSIGMINLTMVVNSTNVIMKSDRDFRIMIL